MTSRLPIRFRRCIVSLMLLLASACTPPDGGRSDRAARVDRLFSDFEQGVRPGLAIAVMQGGEVVFSEGYGYANLEHRVPITEETVFDIASISKQFAGLSIAMLVDQGRISLDDPIHQYVPEMHDFGRPITIDHLVHHTSGIRDWPGSLAIAGWSFDDVISFDQILDFAYHQRTLNFDPGSEYTYSNTGYNLLAETVARVTGQSFREWTDENLFEPLGMESTHFHDDHSEVVSRRALGYAQAGDGEYTAVQNNLTALGSSSLYTTVMDLAKWMANFESAEVGGASALELWRTRGVLNDGSEIPYAFGIVHGEYRGLPMLRHGGSWAAFRTELTYFPEHDFGVVILANGGINPAAYVRQVTDIYLDGELGEADGPRDVPPPRSEPVSVASALLSEYEGTYRLGPGWYVTITSDGETLTTQATQEDAFPMMAQNDSTFWVEAYGAGMVFGRDEAGQVAHITYRGIHAPRMSGEAGGGGVPVRYAGRYESDELRTVYEVVAEEGGLLLTHPRHGRVPLERAYGGEFVPSGWGAVTVRFEEEGGTVLRMVVNNGERNREMVFARR